MFHGHWHIYEGKDGKKHRCGFCFAFVPLKKTFSLSFKTCEGQPCCQPEIYSWGEKKEAENEG